MEDKLPGAEAARAEEGLLRRKFPLPGAGSLLQKTLPWRKKKLPADTALRAEETPFAEEVSPLPFSAHL